MTPDRPSASRKWRASDVWALVFLFLGLVMLLLVASTGAERFLWTLWISVPMLMFSLAYLAIVSILPIFLGQRSDDGPRDEPPPGEKSE